MASHETEPCDCEVGETCTCSGQPHVIGQEGEPHACVHCDDGLSERIDAAIAKWTTGFRPMANKHFSEGYGHGFRAAQTQRRLGVAEEFPKWALVLEVDRLGGLTRADEEYNDGLKVGFHGGVLHELVF